MKMLFHWIDRHAGPAYLLVVALGYLFPGCGRPLAPVIPAVVFVVMYFNTLNISLSSVQDSLTRWRLHLLLLVLHYVLIPLLVFAVIHLLPGITPGEQVSYLFLFLLPTGVANVFFTRLLEGDESFALLAVTFGSLASPIATPLMMGLLAGQSLSMPLVELGFRIGMLVVVPFALSLLTQQTSWHSRLLPLVHPLSLMLFLLTAFTVSSVIFARGLDLRWEHLLHLPWLFLLFAGIYAGSHRLYEHLAGKRVANATGILVSRRNTSLGIGVAITVFDSSQLFILLIYKFIQNVMGLTLRRFRGIGGKKQKHKRTVV